MVMPKLISTLDVLALGLAELVIVELLAIVLLWPVDAPPSGDVLVCDVVAGVVAGAALTEDGGSQTKPAGMGISMAPVGSVATGSVSTGYMLVHSDDKQ
jgi:hypothetical protein